MKKVLLFIWMSINGFFCMVMSVLSVDWLIGGGCTSVLNRKYEPAYFSQIWGLISHIYTWAPENTLFRLFFFVIAFVITIGLPVVLAGYFYIETLKIYKKYRES